MIQVLGMVLDMLVLVLGMVLDMLDRKVLRFVLVLGKVAVDMALEKDSPL